MRARLLRRGSGGGGAECANGIDDDQDGQIDAASERKLRPDPGCMNANDPTESGEVAVPAACAASSGAGVGDDQTVLQVNINAGCGTFTELAVYAAPTAFSCTVFTEASNFGCVIAYGQPFADTRNATDADQADIEIDLNGNANCAVPVTIVLGRRNFEVAELVTPIARCGTPKPACSNGTDDDGDTMADARDAAGATDPDPGCSGPADTSEDSEVGLPAGCTIELATFNNDDQVPGIAVAGCGAIKGAWFEALGGADRLPVRDRRGRHGELHGHGRDGRSHVRGDEPGGPARDAHHHDSAVRTRDGGDHAGRRKGGVDARRLVLMRRVGWRDAGPAGPGRASRTACRAV